MSRRRRPTVRGILQTMTIRAWKRWAFILAAALGTTVPAWAQAPEFTLDESGDWVQDRAPEPGSDEDVIAETTALLAADQPAAAHAVIDAWIQENERTDNPWLPRAYLLRGDALAAMGDEFKAMYDYERRVIQRYPQSEEFVRAIERELAIAIEYAHGKRRKLFGVRIIGTGEIAEETFMRVQERLPGSELAERAAIELADFYYRRGKLPLAAIAYDLYVSNFPRGPHLRHAMERRIRANVAQYKGPEYDGSSILDAVEQTRAYVRMFPDAAEKSALDERLVDRLDDALADQMLAGAKWYLKRSDRAAAEFTLRRLLRRHPNSPAAADALKLMERYGMATPQIQSPPEPHGDAVPIDSERAEGAAEVQK